MRRRWFLGVGVGVVGAGAAAAVLPGWLSSSLERRRPGSSEDIEREGIEGDGTERAEGERGNPKDPLEPGTKRGDTRPMLVFVIPRDQSETWRRGHVFGEYLNHGSDAQLAVLDEARIVCATVNQTKKTLPSYRPAAGKEEPLFLLASPDGKTVKELFVTLPEVPMGGWPKAGSPEEKLEQETIDKRITAIATALAGALPAVPASEVALRASHVREVVVKRPPTGAKWANASGCGSTIEGEKNENAVACGMGHVPARSERFLHFMTKSI